MKRLVTFACTLALLAAAGPATAQQDLLTQCAQVQAVSTPATTVPAQVHEQFQFMCGQIVNAVTNVQPTIGIAFSGGAHTLGTFTTIGRRLGLFPRVAVSARLNAALADVPDLLDGFTPEFDSEGELGPMGTVGLPVGSFQGDVTLGLYNGVSLGPLVGGLGAVDLLGSLSFIPAVEAVGLSDNIVNVGLGARVGILRQGLVMPGISVSGMYRTMLSDVAFGDIANDPAEFSTSLSTLSFRGGVSKGLLMFNVAAGAGYDIYTSDVAFDWRLACPAAQCGEDVMLSTNGGVDGQLRTAAWNLFGNVGMNLVLLNLVGEVGYQKATDIVDAAALREAGLPDQPPTTDDLGGGRFFISLGARLTL